MDDKDRIQIRNIPQQSDFDWVTLPNSIPEVPGQISAGEARYLYWLVSHTYRGWGAVVEIGTWLGKSTVTLAEGLKDSGKTGKIYSYDLFIWGGGDDNRKSGLNLKSQSDFMPYFLKNIEPLKNFIVPQKADFSGIEWKKGSVEILFLDAPKSAQHFYQALLNFIEVLEPGDSILVMQDYQHPLSYELPLMVWGLEDYLVLNHAVSSGGTASFNLKKRITPEALKKAFFNLEKIPESTAAQAWEKILEPLNESIYNRMALSSILHLYAIGAEDRAFASIEKIHLDKRMQGGINSWSKNEKLNQKFSGIFEALAERSGE